MKRCFAYIVLLAVLALACDDTQVNYASTTVADSGVIDVAVEDAVSSERETATTSPPIDDDAGVESCTCAENQIYRKSACVTTLDLGCGVSCSADADCADGLVCLPCAASRDCASKDCAPACGVPDMPHAFVPEPLRLSPTSGPEGESGNIRVEGTSFFIGALGHQFWMDGIPLQPVYGETCVMQLELPPSNPGLYPVYVSQYSGGGPMVLAGFYRFGEGETCTQPGFACSNDAACCNTPRVPVTCTQGRCLP